MVLGMFRLVSRPRQAVLAVGATFSAAKVAHRRSSSDNATAHCWFGGDAPTKLNTRDAELKANASARAQLESIISTANKEGADAEVLDLLGTVENQLWLRGKLHRIVVTGGPCGGKSTILTDLIQLLQERHYLVSTMPEVATMMFDWSGQRMWADYEKEEINAHLQVLMSRLQMHIEDAVVDMARQSLSSRRAGEVPPKGVVILYDRGVVDNRAYCSESVWASVLVELGTTTARLRDQRYDHVIHLVTAAIGAEQHYTLEQAEGGGARHETLEEAQQLDILTQEAWNGAESHYIVRNEGNDSFGIKRERVKNIVLSCLGEDVPDSSAKTQIVCDYLPEFKVLALAKDDKHCDRVAKLEVKTLWISDDSRLQTRITSDESCTHVHQKIGSNGRIFTQYQMDGWTCRQKIKQARDALKNPREMTDGIIMFSYKDAYIRCHSVTGAADQPLLIVEVERKDKRLTLPPWLKPTELPKDHAHMNILL